MHYRLEQFKGKKVIQAVFREDVLILTCEDGKLQLFDSGQSCCESRYLTCDDDLTNIQDGNIVDIDVVEVDHRDSEYGDVNEIHFLKVQTTTGSITVACHVNHNGYYGGISLDYIWNPDMEVVGES